LKIPPHESAGNVLRAVGLLIAGMIIGAALFLSIYNQRLNMMIVQNRELVSENVRLEGEVEDLKKNKNQQNTINLLNIYVESADDSPLDKITESELKRRIHGELKKIIVGRKISDFAAMPDVYEQILKEKPYTGVLDKDYIVQSVRWIVLTQTELKVWVTVKEWKRIPMA